MEVILKGGAEEIAALVVEVQERHCLDKAAKETMELLNQKVNHHPPILCQNE